MTTKEKAKAVREELKKKYPGSKFSVSCESYSQGSSVHISPMESDINIIRRPEEIGEQAIHSLAAYRHTREEILNCQNKNYHQLNPYNSYREFEPDNWNNGVFLTKEGHELFREVVKMWNKYNDSEYGPHLSINIGKWDKPFSQKSGTDSPVIIDREKNIVIDTEAP
ncbi:MAG: LPD29 domain-containing protein [Vulcanimicrobiota bacterium]